MARQVIALLHVKTARSTIHIVRQIQRLPSLERSELPRSNGEAGNGQGRLTLTSAATHFTAIH